MVHNKLLKMMLVLLLHAGCADGKRGNESISDTRARDEATAVVLKAKEFAGKRCTEDDPEGAAIAILAVTNEILSQNIAVFQKIEQKALTYDVLASVYSSSNGAACRFLAHSTIILAIRYYQDAFARENSRARMAQILSNVVTLGLALPLPENTIEDFRTRAMELRS